MTRAERIYILIIKVDKLFSFFSSRCFLKEIENMFSVFLSSYSNTRESLEELEKAVETLTCGSWSHSISRSPKLPLDRNTVHVFYFLIIRAGLFGNRLMLTRIIKVNGRGHQPFVKYGTAILTQTNTNKPVAKGSSTIVVKSYTFKVGMSCRCTEVRRNNITTPRATLLVTATRVTRNEEARIESRVADKQLVGVSVVCTHTVPQSIGTSNLPIVPCGRYRLVDPSLEVGLVSSLVIDEDDFCELIKQKHNLFGRR